MTLQKHWEKFEVATPVKTKNVNILKTKKGIDTIFCMNNLQLKTNTL